MERLLKVLTDEPSYGKPENVNLGQFIDDFKKEHIQSGYTLNVLRTYDMENRPIDKYIISIARQDLNQVLENIMTNAKKHAFKNLDDPANRVILEMSEDLLNGQPAVVLWVKNNGALLPQGMSAEKVFTWSESSSDGDGIGGWQIRQIIEHFRGEVTIVESQSDKDNFTLAYKIILPLIN